MEKTLLKNTLRELFSDFYETPIPEMTRRQIDIPEAPRFATVILGMRRTGKTFLLYQRMNDLLSSGIPSALSISTAVMQLTVWCAPSSGICMSSPL